MAIARLNFLVVEDHDFQRKMLVRILHGIGANAIYEAKDGVGALAILQEPGKPVDIIISDLDMPGMDGMAFVRNLGKVAFASPLFSPARLIAICLHPFKPWQKPTGSICWVCWKSPLRLTSCSPSSHGTAYLRASYRTAQAQCLLWRKYLQG